MSSGFAPVLVWSFDSIRIVEKLAALAAYLREQGLHATWVCLSRETQIALLAYELPCIAVADFVGDARALVAAGEALRAGMPDVTADDWRYDQVSGRRITPLPGGNAAYPELQYLFYLGLWEQLLDEFRPELVLNLNGVPSAARALDRVAAKRCVPALYWENGLVPGALVVDARGVNYNAHLAGDRWTDPALPQPAEADLMNARACRNRLVQTATTLLESGDRPDPERLRRRLGIGPEQRIVLLPLQVDTDTNLICHSPLFTDMKQLVAYAAREVSGLKDHVLVVKEHPKRAPHGNAELSRICSGRHVRYVHDINATALLAAADMVVTVNSTVGFEALLRGIPVVALGRSVYSEKGLTRDLYLQGGPLAGRLTTALASATSPEPRSLDRFLAYVFRHHLLQLDPANDALGSRAAMARLFTNRVAVGATCASTVRSASLKKALRRMQRSAGQIRRLRGGSGARRVLLIRQGASSFPSVLAGKLQERFPGCTVEMRESKPWFFSSYAGTPAFDLR